MADLFVINNKVSEEEFEQIVYSWIAAGDYTPDDIIENIITHKNKVLMPLYYWGDNYTGSCSASLGYDRQEFYQVKDSNGNLVTRSRWVTDWRPHSQTVHGSTVTLTYAGRHLAESISSFIENMSWRKEDLINLEVSDDNYNKAQEFFLINKNESWDNKGYYKAFAIAQQNTAKQLPSPKFRNLALDIKFQENLFFRVIAPYWIFEFVYQDKPYYVIVDGNNPDRIDGIKPVDKKRVQLVQTIRFVGWITALLAVLIGLYIYFDESFAKINFSWQSILITILGLTLFGFLIEFEVKKIKNASKKIRAQTLNNKFQTPKKN